MDNKNLYIDVSWLKGKLREVTSSAIMQKAVENGYSISGTVSGFNAEAAYIILYKIKTIGSSNGCPKAYSEISVNDALNGNYKIKKQKPIIKIGDVIYAKGKFHIIKQAYSNEVLCSDDCWITLSDGYKLCRKIKQIKFYLGQKVCIKYNSTYGFVAGIKPSNKIMIAQKNGIRTFNDDEIDPVSLKEKYEVIK